AASRPLTREQIGAELWPGTEEPVKFKMRFKNEIYRLRCAVGQETIRFQRECYQFNAGADHEYDVEAFKSFVALAKLATSAAEQIDLYQRAVDLAQGEYLEGMGSAWVIADREALHQAYLLAALALAELYFKEGKFPTALQTCDQAITRDSTFEAAYRLRMQIFHRMGDRPSIVHTYRACERCMQELYNMPPSEETQRLYHDLTS
ncbi:MAG: AfsR/SARP family transcriptional regulator, partial [Anaerolineales bacterium]